MELPRSASAIGEQLGLDNTAPRLVLERRNTYKVPRADTEEEHTWQKSKPVIMQSIICYSQESPEAVDRKGPIEVIVDRLQPPLRGTHLPDISARFNDNEFSPANHVLSISFEETNDSTQEAQSSVSPKPISP